jgi:cytochrome P450
MRDMKTRRWMTAYVQARLNMGLCATAANLTKGMTKEERALHIQGVFLTTGVVQMSEAMAHVCLALASFPEVRQKLEAEQRRNADKAAKAVSGEKKAAKAAVSGEKKKEKTAKAGEKKAAKTAKAADDEDLGPDRTYLDMTLKEVLRLYPLFGIAHRISNAPIEVASLGGGGGGGKGDTGGGSAGGKGSSAGTTTLPKGTVLCFNYLNYQMIGHRNAAAFYPERWARGNKKERSANYAPFGVMRNRPCPGQRVAQILMLEMTDAIMR